MSTVEAEVSNIFNLCLLQNTSELSRGAVDFVRYLTYRKVASTNASRFVTPLVFKHTQNDNFLI